MVNAGGKGGSGQRARRTAPGAMADARPRTASLRQTVFWCLYDWGNSAFPAIVLSFVFAPYFVRSVAETPLIGEARWGFAMSASALAIAILCPVFGALADRGGRRRPWLGASSLVAIAATAALWLVEPEPGATLLALVLMAIANAAFELGYVFYNALLPDVAPEDAVGRVSGFGWGAGYLGSVASLGMVLVLFIWPAPPLFGLDPATMEPLRAAALFAAAWFAVFAAPLVFFGPPEVARGGSAAAQVREGLADLWSTARSLRRTPSIAWFLAAHMVFIDGVNTLFVFGPLYAVAAFGFSEGEILFFGMTIFLAAGAGSFALGWLDDRIGAKPVLLGSLVACFALIAALMLVEDKTVFWLVAAMMSLTFGPIQSCSRSLLVRLSPQAARTKLFGLYALAGRATAALGPALAGWMILATGNQRGGLLVVATLLALGAVLLLPVRERPQSESGGG